MRRVVRSVFADISTNSIDRSDVSAVKHVTSLHEAETELQKFAALKRFVARGLDGVVQCHVQGVEVCNNNARLLGGEVPNAE